jgi:hypothetical protein
MLVAIPAASGSNALARAPGELPPPGDQERHESEEEQDECADLQDLDLHQQRLHRRNQRDLVQGIHGTLS